MNFDIKRDFKLTITNALVVSYILIFIGQYIYGMDTSILKFALNGALVINYHEYWRIFTSAFIHADFLHVLMNAYFIFYVGNGIENMLGKGRYVALVIFSILTSSGLVIALDMMQMSGSYTLGASGFGYGLVGLLTGFAIMYPNRYYRRYVLGLLTNIGLYTIIFFVLRSSVSWAGHFGGFGGGLIMALILNAFFKKEEW